MPSCNEFRVSIACPFIRPTINTAFVASFPDAHKAADDLNSFAKANEGRLYKLFKTCIDPQTDLKGLVKATVGIFKLIAFCAVPVFIQQHSTDTCAIPERARPTRGTVVACDFTYNTDPSQTCKPMHRQPIIDSHPCKTCSEGRWDQEEPGTVISTPCADYIDIYV
jgi:hypothetical protein